MASSAAQHVHCAAGMAILCVLSVTFLLNHPLRSWTWLYHHKV